MPYREQLRQAVLALDIAGTPAALECLYRVLCDGVAGPVARFSTRTLPGPPMEREEAASLILDHLISTPALRARLALPCTDPQYVPMPGAWLIRLATNTSPGIRRGWVFEEAGRQAAWSFDEDDAPQLTMPVPDQCRGRLHRAAMQTANVLEPFTPTAVRETVRDLVWWIAEDAPANPSKPGRYLADAVAAHPEISAGQAAAVLNITLGGRPNRAATSLLGGFLLDEDLDWRRLPCLSRAVKRTYASAIISPLQVAAA